MTRRPTKNHVRMEITDTIDLHHFKPNEVPELVKEYLRECKRIDIREVRIIHGKGKGVLMKTVQRILAEDPDVLAFGPASDRSGWGVTIARIRTNSMKMHSTQEIGSDDPPSLPNRLSVFFKSFMSRSSKTPKDEK